MGDTIRTSSIDWLPCTVPMFRCSAFGVVLVGVWGVGEGYPRGTSRSGVSAPVVLDDFDVDLERPLVSVSADKIESRVSSEPWSSLWMNGIGGTSLMNSSCSTLSVILADRLRLLLAEECFFFCLRSSASSSREVCFLNAAAVRPDPARAAISASRAVRPLRLLCESWRVAVLDVDSAKLRSEVEPRLDLRSLRAELPETSPDGSTSRLSATLGLLPWMLGTLDDLETRRREVDGSRELVVSTVSNVAPLSRDMRSNLSLFLEVRFSSLSAFSSGRISRLMASSTVASSLGLLMDDVVETPERTDGTPDLRSALEESKLDSVPLTALISSPR